ncbi:MAG: antitoxin [Chloroflexota bacterium]
MTRTTIDLDAAVLRELKRRKRASGQSIGQLASELLAGALHEPVTAHRGLHWRSARMGARVDLDDKEAVRRALDNA